MKKTLAIILSIIMIIAAFPITAFAENGPSEGYEDWGDGQRHYFASIYAYTPDSNGDYFNRYGMPLGESYEIFADNKANNCIEGVSYNRSTNELTLDDGVKNIKFSIHMMGDDFTLRVDGRVSLGQIYVGGGNHGGNLNIKGNGELTVNEAKKFDSAIEMYGTGYTPAKVQFGPDVQVKLYASEGNNVIVTENCTTDDVQQAYVFEKQTAAKVTKSNYTFEKSKTVKAIYLSDPEEERWGGYLYESKNDPNGFYVVDTERDDETGETLWTLGRYVYVAKFGAYVRDYSFGDRYSNGYEYAFTESEWQALSDEYTPKQVLSDEPDSVLYYDKEELDAEYPYGAPRVTNVNDPNGIYAYNPYKTTTNGEVTFEGFQINRYVYADGTTKYIRDETYEPVLITQTELDESDEWSIVYAYVTDELRWTGTIVQSDMYVYADDKGNEYVTDYNGNAYTYGDEGVYIGSDFYRYAERADGVNTDDLEMVFETIAQEGAYNYALTGEEFVYNENGGHTHFWHGKQTKAPTCAKAGVMTFTCDCGATRTAEIPATGIHTYDSGKITSTTSTTYTKTFTCKVCKHTYKKKYDKNANPISVKGKTVSIKYSALKNKNQTVKKNDAFSLSNAKGKVTYKKSSGNSKITVSNAGKITVKKGLKKGTYSVKVKVKAAGTNTYKAATKTATVKIKVQ